jgi:molybdenum cofactor guanylyltransferase
MYHRPMPALSAYVLAGGQSSRMGTDKAFQLLEGLSLLTRVLDVARSVTDDVHIVGQKQKYSSFAPTIEDIFPGCGPLGGIHAALRSSDRELNLILAVDVPFVTSALLRHLVALAENSAAGVTVPRVGKGWQPLCAVYRREFADAAEEALRAGRYKIDALFVPTATQIVGEEQLQAAGFSPNLFRNLNTPQELAQARE